MDQRLIEEAKAYVLRLFEKDRGGHDAAHTLRVYRNALWIARREGACDREAVALAALLHDADDPKLFQTENFANARAFLTSRGVAPERIDFICSIIASVSFSKNKNTPPESREAGICRDADRLDAMGAVGIARTFAFGGAHGRSMEDSVRHFREKLLLLKDGLCTAAAREIGESRHAFLKAFLDEFRRETEGGAFKEEDRPK